MTFKLLVKIGDRTVVDRPSNYQHARQILPGIEQTVPMLLETWGEPVTVIAEVDGVTTIMGAWSPQPTEAGATT